MKPHASRVMAAALIGLMLTGCAGMTAPTASPTQLAAATASPTLEPTAAPTESPTPGPTRIPYPGPSAPPGTLTLKISAQNFAFDSSALSASANTPFVISFDNEDTSPGCGSIGCAHNVAVRLGNTILFNPVPAIVGPAHADYFIPEGLAAGTYKFFCVVHPNMQGDLTIT